VLMIATLLLAAALQVAHPCDAVIQANPSFTTSVKAGFCYPKPGATGAELRIDDKVVWVGVPIQAAGPNAEGLYYYETPAVTVPIGTHVATASVEGIAGSDRYSFSIIASEPTPPPPVSVCDTAPLVITINKNNGWPADGSGAQLRWTTTVNGVRTPAVITFNPFLIPWEVRAVDARGCVASTKR
jgi:hypothetical protein